MNYEDLYNTLLQYMGEENVRHMHEIATMRVNYDQLKRSRDQILKQTAELQDKYNAAMRVIEKTDREDYRNADNADTSIATTGG